MAALPEPPSPTRAAIFAAYEAGADAGFRPHLGASQIGKSCERALWYDFRWTTPAARVINAARPPVRISEDSTWFDCRFCDHHDLCHSDAAAAVTCRSCLHATPSEGGWTCARWQQLLDLDVQRQGCDRHFYVPDLVPGDVVDAGDDHVVYRMRDGSVWVNDAQSEVAAC